MASGSTVPPRPKSHASLVDAEQMHISRLSGSLADLEETEVRWIPVATCLAHFRCSIWIRIMREHILHPERNSSTILRADILSEYSQASSLAPYTTISTIQRKLLPRRPNLDAPLLQMCKVYEGDTEEGLVIYTPRTENSSVTDPSAIPFYHPRLRAIAFHFVPRAWEGQAGKEEADTVLGDIYLHIVPFADDVHFNAAVQVSHRLSRIALSLLETQAQHSWGRRHNYQKRVIHDTLVPRDEYLDLYLQLKDKYASALIACWVESTDASKHVFEDIGIAAFLILLWKETERHGGVRPNSFVDIGCGNGLLVHLLNAEGYNGFGFDLQQRKSWAVWQGRPGGADLRILSLDAPTIVNNCEDLLSPGSFLIGNHADELTSWLPLLAHAVPHSSGFVNIPCCLYQLDGQHFGMTKHLLSDEDLANLVGRSESSSTFLHSKKEFERGPPTQNSGIGTTRNVAYLRYLSHLHLQAGWHLEKEALRIPSTKNWALVGRRRVWETSFAAFEDVVNDEIAVVLQEQAENNVQQLTTSEGCRWTARRPVGNAASSSH